MARVDDGPVVARIFAFLAQIGIGVVESDLPSTFLPGVGIRGGCLHVDRSRLLWPGDLLHEAGHIAVTPERSRSTLDGEVAAEVAPHAGEVEATAWAWAALLALGLPAEVLFHPGGYRGHSAGLIRTFSLGVYPGAAGLAAAGMTSLRRDHRGAPPYPHMLHWLRR